MLGNGLRGIRKKSGSHSRMVAVSTVDFGWNGAGRSFRTSHVVSDAFLSSQIGGNVLEVARVMARGSSFL